MNKEEALVILRSILTQYQERSYLELVGLIGKQQTLEVTSTSGTHYQIEIEVFWDDKPDGNVRVFSLIDDGGIRAFLPLGEDFIMTPDSSFVDERVT